MYAALSAVWRGRLFFSNKTKFMEGEPTMNELTIIKKNGGAYIDSREVARAIGKRHDNLLRDIGNYLDIIEDIAVLNFEGCDFFVESNYLDVKGRARLCYLISKAGCELIANRLIGGKGILFTAAYINGFKEAEAAEREAEIKSNARPRLSEFNSAVRNVLSGMSQCYTLPQRVMSFLRSVYEPLGINVQHELDGIEYLSATQIARLLSIYSRTGRPHGHAVSAIISRLGNVGHHSIAIPYGLVGVMIRYDQHIVEQVRQWIESNKYPTEVPHLNFCYHIYYHSQCSLFDEGGDIIDFDNDDFDFDNDDF